MNKLFILLVFLPVICLSQVTNDSIYRYSKPAPRPTYYIVSAGMSKSVFRDFATSPLFYNSYPFYIDAGRYRSDEKRVSDFRAFYSSGNYIAGVGDHKSSSIGYTLGLNYSTLFGIFNTENWDLKFGGMVDNSAILRFNESLQNNALGLDLFINFFGSAQITRNVSRKRIKYFKLWFIKYQFIPRKRELIFNVNYGFLNSYFRNGYAYTGQSEILNEPELFDGYTYEFAGFRMITSLEYRIYLANKNAVSITYNWDAFNTGGEFDKFEMAQHILKLSLYFNTK